MKEYSIQVISMNDHAELLEFWKSCPGICVSSSDSAEHFSTYLKRNPLSNFCVRMEGRIVATALAGHDGRRGTLRHVAVSPEHQKNGLARLLVARCQEQLQAEGIERTYAIVLRDNEDGLEFWSHIGFEDLEECKLFAGGTVSR